MGNPSKAYIQGLQDTVQIPLFAGIQKVTTSYQRRTQRQYLCLATVGLLTYFKSESPALRVLGLSVLYPGSGFLAVGGIKGVIGALLSLAVLPLSLFAWFGAGGVAFVLLNWLVPALVACWCSGELLWEPAAYVALAVVTATVTYNWGQTSKRSRKALNLRDERNVYLKEAEMDYLKRTAFSSSSDPGSSPPDDELSLQHMRFLQRLVEIAYQPQDDFSNFDVIDQFQTSALRYQCYSMQWSIAFAQHRFTPSFMGYMKESQERLIERSLTERVMNFWKWESLWGKFTLNWDPVVKDNIMVTGYILLSLALYEKLTGDNRYRQKGALKFDITSTCSYYHSTDSVMDALMQNWENSTYCLFPCEPNWIYSSCNLVGMEGAMAYESYRHTSRATRLLKERFHRQFEEEFMNPDGSVVTIRSSMTGLTIPGLAGVLGDVGGANSCAAVMPNTGRRLWLVSQNSTVRQDATGKFELYNLVGADKMDVGNYTPGEGFAHAVYAICAGEYGEYKLRDDFLDRIDNDLHPIETHNHKTGSLRNKGLSTLASAYVFRARISKKDAWNSFINQDIDEKVRTAPKLSSVPFPEVLVAKCAPNAKDDLEMVMYPGMKEGIFQVTFSDLKPSRKYTVNGEAITVHSNGTAKVKVELSGRTELVLVGKD